MSEKVTNATEWGPASRQVAENLVRVREARGFSTTELTAVLKEIGHKIPATGITRIEKHQRRVNADDLLALAAALNVSPLTLLLPPHAGDDEFKLAPNKSVTSRTAWAWGAAQQTALDDEPEPTLDLGDGVRFYTELENERRQEFYRAQEAFLVLAQPEEIRQELSRGEGHRAVRLAQDLVDAIRSLVAPEFTIGPAALHAKLQARRNRGARRLYTALGLELDEIEEHLPPLPVGAGDA